MARPCTVCHHRARGEIDKALASGEAAAAVAARYRTEGGQPLGRMAMQRHRDAHLPARLMQAAEQEDRAQAIDVYAQLKAINSAAFTILAQARQAGTPSLALAAIDRIHKQIELQAKLLGDLDDRPTVNVLVSGEWLGVRAAVLEALRPYPDARTAVAARLRTLEAG